MDYLDSCQQDSDAHRIAAMGDAFGDRFYALSRALGFTSNTALAVTLRVPPNEVQRLNEKLFYPSLAKMEKVAKRLRVPVEALTFGVRHAQMPRPPALPDRVRLLIGAPLDAARPSESPERDLPSDASSSTVAPTPQDDISDRESEADLLRALTVRSLSVAQRFAGIIAARRDEEHAICRAVETLLDEIEDHGVPARPKARRHSGGGR